jgi:YD repeat-containing protein
MTLSAADRIDIISRADTAATRRDADAYADLFTADAVLDGSQGRHPAQPITIHTAAAITQALRRTGNGRRISERTVAEYR